MERRHCLKIAGAPADYLEAGDGKTRYSWNRSCRKQIMGKHVESDLSLRYCRSIWVVVDYQNEGVPHPVSGEDIDGERRVVPAAII